MMITLVRESFCIVLILQGEKLQCHWNLVYLLA